VRRVVVVLLAAAAAAAVAGGARSQEEAPPQPLKELGVTGHAYVTPHSILFGDPSHARVELLVDRRVLDPNDVAVATRFRPFRVRGPVRRERTDYERLTRLRYDVDVECIEDACILPQSARRIFHFPPARVRVKGRAVETLPWPSLIVSSRLRDLRFENLDERNARFRQPTAGLDWRAEIGVQPATWRIEPTLAIVLLVAVALVLLAASLVLTAVAYPRVARKLWRRRRRLSPLERALVGFERANARGREDERRVALDDLAAALRASDAPGLAGTAYELAWAERPPAPERTVDLAGSVRELIAGRSNGRA